MGSQFNALKKLGKVINDARQDHQTSDDLSALVRAPVTVGFTIVFLFFFAFGAWAAFFPLSSAAIAPGFINPEGNRRTVQHLEGGIIKEIHVRQGQTIEKGEPIVTLNDVASRSEIDIRRTRTAILKAEEIRIRALMNKDDEIVFPADIKELARAIPEVSAALSNEERVFSAGRQASIGRERSFEMSQSLADEQVQFQQSRIETLQSQLDLLSEEIRSVSALVDQRLISRSRLIQLRREEAETQGEMNSVQASVSQIRQETERRQLDYDSQKDDDLRQNRRRLSEINVEVATFQDELARLEDALGRTVVRAPVSGTIVDLQINTITGVVAPGQPIVDIVPDEAELIITTRVQPVDIDVVSPGLTAEIYLTAFVQRNLPRLEGIVRTVSADRLTDEATGEIYYEAIIEVPKENLATLGDDIVLTAGMPADVAIVTGNHTMLQYLSAPVQRSLSRTLREER